MSASRGRRRWRARGGRVIGVSNQGGIALGIVTARQVAAAMHETQRQCGGLLETIAYCPHHPGATDPAMARCGCRKPSPGLVIGAALELAVALGESYPPHLGLLAGDRDEDKECARLAGMNFMWAAEWRAQAL